MEREHHGGECKILRILANSAVFAVSFPVTPFNFDLYKNNKVHLLTTVHPHAK